MSVEPAPPPPPQESVAKDLLAGTISGWAQVLVGQPFDIVKVRLQSSNQYPSALNCATRILREEGPTAFYKGTVMPLLGVGACVSLQFAFLQAGKRFFSEQNAKRGAKGDKLSLGQLYLAGAGAGIGNSIVSGPVEHIRIRLQTQGSGPPLYTGPGDALKKIYATDGLRGVFQGQVATILREGYGYGLYFLSYEYLVQRALEKQGWQRKDIPMVYAAGYGAVAGWVMWLCDYPLDVIKSRMQTDGLPSQKELRKYSGVLDCTKKLYAEGGVGAFTRGLGPTLIRSPFANGATFVAFELAMRQLNKF
ncbi:hypothetical protein MNV49_000497 [Pseudohyphozyma bogoriensis]|nr:hypothetical protein MNV49_000497 [Pseudohyphozyma bogoriensis]